MASLLEQWLALAMPMLEVLFFNLLTFELCARRRYSLRYTAGVLAAFTAVFLAAWLGMQAMGFPTGNGQMTPLSFLYLLPYKYLYKGTWTGLAIVMCTCWIYTLGVLTLTIQLTALLDLNGPWAVVAVESLLFLASLTVFYRLALPKYNYVLQHMEGAPAHWNHFIVAENCLWLLLLYTMHLSFLDTEGKVVHLLAVLLLLTVIYVSYFILYRALLDTDRMVQLEKAALEDPLTRLGNRACLWQDLDAMLGEQKLFSVVFMDLDRFKQINDQYGHMVGDAYLQHFARISAEILAPRGRVYRFGGDEFVAVWPGVIPAAILQEIKACSRWDEGAPCPFNQVSIGVLHCRPPHRGAEKILQQVDQLMYRNKLKKQGGDLRE